MTNLSSWDFIAAQVDTDDGLTGWGYNCTIGEGSETLVTLLLKDLSPRFIGHDPFMVRRLWQEIYLDRYFTGITGVAVQGLRRLKLRSGISLLKLAGNLCGEYSAAITAAEFLPIVLTVAGSVLQRLN